MLKRAGVFSLLILAVLLLSRCRKPGEFPDEGFDERLSGGVNTVFDNTAGAYTHPFPGLNAAEMYVHGLGDRGFEQTFVTAPSLKNNGLGPAFNNVSCRSCHHNDGSGIPTAGEINSALLIRVSLPGSGPYGGSVPVPGYGTQLQDKAVSGRAPEGKVLISYTDKSYTMTDGTPYTLREPAYIVSDLYTPVAGNMLLSPRLAPPVFGLGLLECIPESTLHSLSDEHDLDGDGISGRVNHVWDPATQSVRIGRFGLKANTASLLTQVAGAYHQDMGITTNVFIDESVSGQPQDDLLADDSELPDSMLNAVKFYVQTLSVPARRNVSDPVVLDGKELFLKAGCAKCHIPALYTDVNVAFPALSNQRILPYTDLLLHDMGAGLADGRNDFSASGSEWRTPPLWGLGLRKIVNAPAYYLHDGRARNMTEAIMWHGGEAENSKKFFSSLPASERQAIIKFLESL